jgi:hypothetical protein
MVTCMLVGAPHGSVQPITLVARPQQPPNVVGLAVRPVDSEFQDRFLVAATASTKETAGLRMETEKLGKPNALGPALN